jgi:hypothetical protein
MVRTLGLDYEGRVAAWRNGHLTMRVKQTTTSNLDTLAIASMIRRHGNYEEVILRY